MIKDIPPYPVQWPEGQPRTKNRQSSRFKATLAKAISNVEDSVRLFVQDSRGKFTGCVVTSNASLMSKRPDDPGVSVWFEWDGQMRCIAVDRYDKVEDNLQAIHHVLEARRTELRHAGIHVVRTSFRGFTALPAPSQGTSGQWWDILGLSPNASAEQIKTAYKAKSRNAFEEEQKALNVARDEALRWLASL